MTLSGRARLERLERALRPPPPRAPILDDPVFLAHAEVVIAAFEARPGAHASYRRSVWELDAREAAGEVLTEGERLARAYFLEFLATHPEPEPMDAAPPAGPGRHSQGGAAARSSQGARSDG